MGNAKKDFRKYVELENQQVQRIVGITNQLKSANDELIKIRKLKIDAGIRYYTSEKRKDLLEQIKQLGYSHEEIRRMEPFIEENHWNQDEIDDEILALFQNAEEFLRNSLTTSKKVQSFLSTLGKMITDEGNGQNDN